MSKQDQVVKKAPPVAEVKAEPAAADKIDMTAAVEEIKQLLRSEFEALRKEIELLRKRVTGS